MPKIAFYFPMLQRRANYNAKQNGEYYEYHAYRQEIREDCLGRCVYCDAHENECGGPEAIHLDHFRPQKYEEHKHLINDPNNLVWCCGGCNRFKLDDWPALGQDDTIVGAMGYIDPFQQNRFDYFQICENGKLDALKPPAEYMIKRLALNRYSRMRIRELRNLKYKWLLEFEQWIGELAPMMTAENLTNGQKALVSSHIERLKKWRQEFEGSLLDFQLH
jgi:hypothetical protein